LTLNIYNKKLALLLFVFSSLFFQNSHSQEVKDSLTTAITTVNPLQTKDSLSQAQWVESRLKNMSLRQKI